MAKSLIIVESPTKVRTLKKFLSSDYMIKASVGHVKDLPQKRLGVDVNNGFKPEYITIHGKAKVLNEIKKIAEGAEKIFLAPDPDREGEAISWHIANELDVDKDRIYRVLFNEITKSAVKMGLEKPGRIDIDKVNAQQTRRIMDRLVGYQISPILWEKVKWGLSAGRVQSVAVRLICEREREITAFEPQEYWTITASLEGDTPPQFFAKLHQYKGKKITIPDKSHADAILDAIKGELYQVKKIVKKDQKRRPLPPFITSTLQQEASRLYRFPAKKTMLIAQRLYEGKDLGEAGSVGMITYMRTDSTRLAVEAINEARDYIVGNFGSEYCPSAPRVYKSRKTAQEAHEAIRPTSVSREPESVRRFLTPDEFCIYSLIWKRFLACQISDALFDINTIDIKAGEYMFRATGSVMRFDGYLRLYQSKTKRMIQDEEDGQDKEDTKALPPLKEGESLKLEELIPKQHFTQPPPRYSEATLIRELEEKGIGRPSTYATILGTIVDREYVVSKERQLYPTELGFIITDLLVENFPQVLNVQFTAMMEDRLDKIEDGKEDWLGTLDVFYDAFRLALEKAKNGMKNIKKEGVKTDLICDLCGQSMVIKWGRNGKFLACSAYPKCKNTKEFERTEEGRIVINEPKTADQKCDKCGRDMVIRNGRYGPFLGCSGYPECNNIMPLKGQEQDRKEENVTEQKCEKCGSSMVVKNGKYGRFLACSNYPKCKHIKPLTLGIKCPQEGCGGELTERRTRQGRLFYSCSRYPDCDYAIWGKPVLSPCPKCGYPVMQESGGKKPSRSCGSKNCDYKEEI
ncbi:type I DNA topoisomerase [bacterium]|nr:type I DNA topoisomerase [bacterium]